MSPTKAQTSLVVLVNANRRRLQRADLSTMRRLLLALQQSAMNMYMNMLLIVPMSAQRRVASPKICNLAFG